MEIIGLDLHKRESQLSMKAEDGTITDRRIVTSRDRFTAVLGGRPRARILLEATTESEWVARHLESLGHEVIVADPNFAPMYANRSRKTKTDKRDARTLREACESGAYRPAHRLSDARRHVRAELAVRETLVRTRTRYVALAKAFVRRDGLRVASGMAEHVAERIAQLPLSPVLTEELVPLFRLLHPLNAQIAGLDTRIAQLEQTDPAVALLVTAPSIGPITASAFVATVDVIDRFHSAHDLEAYLGLVPRERSSGDKRQLGRITKAGNNRVRWLLVEAGWRLLHSTSPDTAALRAWGCASRSAAASASRASRSPAGSLGCSSRCGATALRTMRPRFACPAGQRRR